ncbi:MAG: FG-GAP repeat domain-containing protein [Candidatus Aminicenantaceae bacterium]
MKRQAILKQRTQESPSGHALSRAIFIIIFSIITVALLVTFLLLKKSNTDKSLETSEIKNKNQKVIKKIPLVEFSATQDRSPEKLFDTNQLMYLETPLVYYPDSQFPKLTTPMWIGEPGVEAVIILSIDDMRNVDNYDKRLHPIFKRLKEIDRERIPLSIMTRFINPGHPTLQRWLKEGITMEVHTVAHHCPLLHNNDFERALYSFNSCIDLLYIIPGNTPLAFRMPCCDSQNSVSPRFFSEIFLHQTPYGHSLRVDSSIFLLLTPQDKEIPQTLVASETGESIFKKYIADRDFVNYIENYPYPYLVHNALWEFPCIIPSDSLGSFKYGNRAPQTLADLKKALSAVVAKKGAFTMCFHPVSAEWLVELVDYAVSRYGKRVKFLNFKEAYHRILTNLLGGMPVRYSGRRDNGIRLLDLNNDGYLDVIIAHPDKKETRIWDSHSNTWKTTSFPHAMVDRLGRQTGLKFVRIRNNGFVSIFLSNEKTQVFHHFDGTSWGPPVPLESLFPTEVDKIFASQEGKDRGLRVIDFNMDGFSDFVYNNESENFTLQWRPKKKRWTPSTVRLPGFSLITDETGLDRGHRFVDLNRDGFLDSVYSNEEKYSVALYTGEQRGWADVIFAGNRKENYREAVPPIVEGKRLAGAWFRNGILYLQNESTGNRPMQILKYLFPFLEVKNQ